MAGPLFADRVMESSTTTGTGTYNLAGAITGFQGFVAGIGSTNTCWYCAHEVDGNGVPSGGWEVGIGVVTDAATDTLSRAIVVASSNANAAVNWAAGTRRIFVTAPAAQAIPSLEMGGRLTTESGVPVSTSDRTAQSTLYYTPYLHNRLTAWNGSGWQRYTFSEISLALSGLTSGKNYDVFVYDNAGTLTLELSAAWTLDGTRANALGLQDGVSVGGGTPAATRRFVGTIRTTSTTTTQDSGGGTTTQVGGRRFVWNAYNQVPRFVRVIDTTDNWSYTTASIRVANGAAGNFVDYVTGDGSGLVQAEIFSTVVLVSNSTAAMVGVGVDSQAAFSGLVQGGYSNVASAVYEPIGASYSGWPGLGYHNLYWLEKGANGSTCLFLGDNAGDDQQTGLTAVVLA